MWIAPTKSHAMQNVLICLKRKSSIGDPTSIDNKHLHFSQVSITHVFTIYSISEKKIILIMLN